MEEEIIKIILAVVAALLYYLFKSKPVERSKDIPEKYNSPMAQVAREEAVEKTVSFADILKKLEQNEPKLNVAPPQEMITARPAQLKKMLSERIVRLDESENKPLDKINSYKNKPLIKDKDKEAEDAKELQTQKNKSQNKEINNQRDEISDLKRELERYKAYDKSSKQVKNEALTKMLADPESVRNSFVLSEILNRKI